MPRRGGGTNPEEAAAFVTRLAKDRETFADIQAREAWERHVREYLTGDPEGQLSPALERFQRYAYEEMRSMMEGLRLRVGREVFRPGVERVVIRERGRFTSLARAFSLLRTLGRVLTRGL